MKKIIECVSTFFYLGNAPYVPGTVGSLGALGLYFLFKNNFCLYTILLIVVTILGYVTAGQAEKIFRQKDSSRIVIDEAAGLLLAFWGMRLNIILVAAGFLIFRVLDIVKVYPADRMEKLKGSRGIMGDDLVCGLYTNIILQILTRIM